MSTALLCLCMYLACGVVPVRAQGAPYAAAPVHPASSPTSDGYVGDEPCKTCHAGIYRTYTQTAMGRSMVLVTPELIQTLKLPASVYNAKIDRHFETFSRDGHLFQSEWQSGADGREIFRNTQEMTWIMGAGSNGFGAVLKRGDFLFEAPLSFYTRAQTWELSPGYENHEIAFNRPIQADCIACHAGRPALADAASGKFQSQPFGQLAIGCENCHGPGATHVAAMQTQAHTATRQKKTDAMGIANPADWDAALQNDLCMSCHEGGDARVSRPGKTYADFRPGEPLDKTVLIYMKPLSPSNADDTEHVQHYLQMTMSKCYRGSQGRLSCLTCHDPHVQPGAAEAPAFFNRTCVACHQSSTQVCSLSQSVRAATQPADNCIGCHMPRRQALESAHTTLANHRILARPGEPWPDTAASAVEPGSPDLVELDSHTPGREAAPVVVLLQAYALMMKNHPEYTQSYTRILSKAEAVEPDDAYVQTALALRDLGVGANESASAHAERAIALDRRAVLAYAYLSEALKRQGRLDESLTASAKAVELEPYNASLERAFIGRLLTAKRYQQARDAAQDYLKKFPEDEVMRSLLASMRAPE